MMEMNLNFIFIIEAAVPISILSLTRILFATLLLVTSLRASDSELTPVANPTENPGNISGPIQDNSFLIEEAYNQEDGVVQHISYVQRSFMGGAWVYSQTDEWPVRSLRHQLSLTMSAAHSSVASGFGLGDTAINYRYQLLGSGEARFAIAPRISALLASGSFRLGRGNGALGWQTNLPFSWQHNSHVVTHWNAGVTWVPRERAVSGETGSATNYNLGQSVIWLATRRVNGLLETLWTSTAQVVRAGVTQRRQDLYLSPGVRWAHNFSSGLQIVPGIGVPVGVGPSANEVGVIFYLSFEHPWGIAHSR